MKLFCVIFAVICTVIAGKRQPSNDDFWLPVYHRIESPCSPFTSSPENDSLLPDDNSTRSRLARTRGCLPLNKAAFEPPAREAQTDAAQLLQMRRAQRWVRGPYSRTAEILRCDLETSVPLRKRQGLTKPEMKVTEDLIQLASFAYYIEEAASTLKRRDGNVKNKMADLSRQLRVVACNLRPAVTQSLRPYVIRDDVPVDLRHTKKGSLGRVATYVIMEKAEEFLRRLPGSYRRRDLNICKRTPLLF